MKARTAPTPGKVLAAVAILVASSSTAGAASLALGLQGGYYRPEILIPSARGQTVEADAGFVSPVVDLDLGGGAGLTFKYVFAPYSFDVLDPDQGSPRGFRVLDLDVVRHDLDVAFRYRTSPRRNVSVTAFAGFRYERQDADVSEEIGDVSFDVYALPVGASFAYAFPDLGLSPFLSVTVFPWAYVDDFEGTGRDQDDEGFGGLAIEGGLAYSLYPALEVPVSFTASYRYQQISPDLFEERVQQATLGVFYHLLDL